LKITNPLSPVKILLLLGLCFFSVLASAQKKNAGYQYHIRKSAGPIVIDGLIDSAWLKTDSADKFAMVLPMDTSLATVHTIVRMTYDNNNIYVLAVCYTAGPNQYMVESLKRDFNFQKNDNFIFFLDPFDARTDGFSFGANAAGAQWDGTMYEGGKVDLSWDNKWTSVVKNYPDRWVFEAAIPFKSIRYKKGVGLWGINFSRNDLKTTEKSAWAPVPRQFPTAALAYTGSLVWDELPPDAGTNISIIPYALGGISKDYTNGSKTDWKKEFGGDAKIGLTSSLNLDLTVNPDFSQVDVDQQVVNLNRYELFFPEKRQFFLESGDLFANFGYSDIRPFFSRRIGLNAPIRFGTRLTGKLDKDWRVGLMDIQTGESNDAITPAQNYGVLTLQRRVFSRSNIGFMFINKDATGSSAPGGAYNRNVGMEYNLASSNNAFTGKLLGIKSFTPGLKGHDAVVAGHLQYLSKYWTLYLQNEYVGKNYTAGVGYVPRVGYNKISPLVLHSFFPKQGAVLTHGIQLLSNYYFDEHFKRTDNESSLAYIVTFRNRSVFTLTGIDTYIKLLVPFDPTNTGKTPLPIGNQNHWNTIDAQFASKPQSLFTYLVEGLHGGYYIDGSRSSLIGQLGYRFQPYVNLSVNTSFNDLHLPAPYNNTSFWLVGPRADVTLSNTLYFTTYVQYNGQVKNINTNVRLQWRYKPASDFFIVYGDNSIPSPYTVKNRQLVVKWTYWCNL
jgi:hypothetical protein